MVYMNVHVHLVFGGLSSPGKAGKALLEVSDSIDMLSRDVRRIHSSVCVLAGSKRFRARASGHLRLNIASVHVHACFLRVHTLINITTSPANVCVYIVYGMTYCRGLHMCN